MSLAVLLVIMQIAALILPPLARPALAAGTIVSRGAARMVTYAPASTTVLRLTPPTGV